MDFDRIANFRSGSVRFEISDRRRVELGILISALQRQHLPCGKRIKNRCTATIAAAGNSLEYGINTIAIAAHLPTV